MAARAWKGVHLGYRQGSNQYRIYHPEKKKVFERRDVEFHEGRNPTPVGDNGDWTDSDESDLKKGENQSELDSLPNKLRREDLGHIRTPKRRFDHTDSAGGEPHHYNAYDEPYNNSENESEDSDSKVDDGIDNTHHFVEETIERSRSPTQALVHRDEYDEDESENESEDESEEDLAIEPLNEDSPPPEPEGPQRSGRNTNRPDYAQLHRSGRANMVIAKALAVNALDESITYKDAITCADASKWKSAMEEEIASLHENNTWNLTTLPKDRKVLRGKWVYKKKTTEASTRYKARWVVKGFMQREGIDYTETYASVINKATTKVVMAMAAIKGYYIEQMDIVTAFLYGPIEEEVYVEQPTGFTNGGNRVCKLNKALYGLKQSPRAWYKTISVTLTSLSFVRSQFDHSLFLNKSRNTWITLYMDDIHLIGPDKPYIETIKEELASHYRIKDLGPSSNYLGLEITRDLESGTLTISQKKYIESVLEAHGMADSKSAPTPMEAGILLEKAESEYKATQEFKTNYQSMLGSIMYIMLQTRPDIAYAISKLSQFSSNPTERHYQALKRVLRYLKGTKDLGITYRKGQKQGELLGWTDSSWACDLDDAKSTSGYLMQLHGAAVSWCSQKQPTVAKSTCEAEYMGQSDAGSEIVWLRGLITDLGEHLKGPTTLFADNQGAIRLANNPENHRRTKHIAVKYHYTRELVENDTLKLVYKETRDMLADCLTKPLGRTKFEPVLPRMGLFPIGK